MAANNALEEEFQEAEELFCCTKPVAVSNQCISVSPGCLKFIRENIPIRSQKLTIFNRTKHFIAFRIQKPRTNVFTVSYEKTGIPAGCEETILIKCQPSGQIMGGDRIRIFVTNDSADILTIPLELYPSQGWLTLPKTICMPDVSLGESSILIVDLPTLSYGDNPVKFVVRGEKPEVLSVSPMEGYVGIPNETDKLIFVYTPREYTTLQYKMEIHFPEMDFQPHIITVHMKCAPGIDVICKEYSGTTATPWNYLKKSSPALPKKPKPLADKKEVDSDDDGDVADIFTPAGVMKFLLKPGGKTSAELKGPLGLTPAEERKQVSREEKRFHDKYNKVEIQQKSLLVQHTRNFIGQDPIDDQKELLEETKNEIERSRLDYEKAVGMTDNDAGDLTRSKLKLSRQRPIRDAGYDYKSIKVAPTPSSELDDPQDPGEHRWVKRFILKRFIQSALIVITRWRANKRIVKLKVLVKEVKKSRQLASEAAAETEAAANERKNFVHAIEQSTQGKQPAVTEIVSRTC